MTDTEQWPRIDFRPIQTRKNGIVMHPEKRDRIRTYRKNYYQKNKKRLNEYGKAYREIEKDYYKNHRKEAREYRLKKLYGLTPEQFGLLLKRQKESCAICKTKIWGRQGPHIDHDHISGKVRGILCGFCNTALGLIKENEQTARRMASYIKAYSIVEYSNNRAKNNQFQEIKNKPQKVLTSVLT